jgi:hypothetical protein
MLDFGPQFQNIVHSTDEFGVDDFLQMLLAGAKLKGFFTATCYKPDGSIRWQEKNRNGVTNLGFNLMLDSTFRSASISPISTWYMGLISNASFTTGLQAATRCRATVAGPRTRPTTPQRTGRAWTPSAAASKQITNATPVSFAMNTRQHGHQGHLHHQRQHPRWDLRDALGDRPVRFRPDPVQRRHAQDHLHGRVELIHRCVAFLSAERACVKCRIGCPQQPGKQPIMICQTCLRTGRVRVEGPTPCRHLWLARRLYLGRFLGWLLSQ